MQVVFGLYHITDLIQYRRDLAIDASILIGMDMFV